MIDLDAFTRTLPFGLAYNDSINLENTTAELVKLQLHEQYRSKVQEVKLGDHHDLQVLQFLDQQFNTHLQSQLDNAEISLGVPLLTLSLEDEEFELDEFVDKSSCDANYMNLKVLIENLIFDLLGITKDAILLLAALKQLKGHLQEKKELQLYLLNKITVLHQFITTIVSLAENDSQLLVRILKLYLELQSQLREASREVELAQQKLNNHNSACLVLGYIEDVRISSGLHPMRDDILHRSQLVPNRPQQDLSKKAVLQSFDSLFAHIVHVAAQRNVSLPRPPSPIVELLDLKTKWAQECIDAILASEIPESAAKALVTASPPRLGTVEKTSAELRTALNDLRFSHEYLAKEYELSKESTRKLVNDYRKKIAKLEAEVASNPTVGVAFRDDFDSIELKEKEITKLQKEINMMKIDRVGMNSMAAPLHLPLAMELPFLSSELAVSPSRGVASPRSPTLDDRNSTGLNVLVTRTQGIMSTGILRKEFKKIVTNIQEEYEVMLGEERIRRRKLQEELEKIRAGDSTINE